MFDLVAPKIKKRKPIDTINTRSDLTSNLLVTSLNF